MKIMIVLIILSKWRQAPKFDCSWNDCWSKLFICFTLFYFTALAMAKGRSLSGPYIQLGPKVKIAPTVQHCHMVSKIPDIYDFRFLGTFYCAFFNPTKIQRGTHIKYLVSILSKLGQKCTFQKVYVHKISKK